MNKARILTIALLIAGASLVFANGSQEGTSTGTTGETLTLTGKIKLQANDFPVLVTSKGEYELMYPRYYSDDIQIKEGETITVTGVTVTGPRFETDSDDKYLAVTKATIAGKEYVVPEHRNGVMSGYGRMMDRGDGNRGYGNRGGGRGGMMGGRL